MRIAVIDLDTITFLVAYKQFDAGNRDRPEEVKTHVKEFLSTILLNIKATHYMMYYQVSGHQNFRKYFYPDYKANRPPTPEFMDVWKDTILAVYDELGAIGLKYIESDDAVSMYVRYCDISYSQSEVIVVSADKDLNQISGEHYNPRKHETYFVTAKEAYYNYHKQLLTGDSTDNIKGIPGIGDKKADKALMESTDNLLYTVFDMYTTHFQDDWYGAYTKTRFLVSLLTELTEEARIYGDDHFMEAPISATKIVTTYLFE